MERHFDRGRIPFVLFLSVLMAGIVLSEMIIPSERFFIALSRAIPFLVFLWILSVFMLSRTYIYRGLLGVSALTLLLISGAQLNWRRNPALNDQHFSRSASAHLLVEILEAPRERETHKSVLVEVLYRVDFGDGPDSSRQLKPVTGRLMLNFPAEWKLEYGSRLIIPSSYAAVSPPRNPGEFDYRRYLNTRSAWHQQWLRKKDSVQILESGGFLVKRWAIEYRKKLLAKLLRCMREERAAYLAGSLVLGDRSQIDQETINHFSLTGTVHVLAVNGMHVGIVYAFLLFSLNWLGRFQALKGFKCLLLLLGIWLYALVTGLGAAVLRAAFMLSFFIIATTFRYQRNIFNSMAASAFFLLIMKPAYLFEIGFQLSYLAVLGIVVFMPSIQRFNRFRPFLIKSIYNYIGLSIVAQMITAPLVAFYFGFFPSYFLPANLLIAVPVSLIINGTLILALFIPEGPAALLFGSLLEELILRMSWLLQWISGLPYPDIPIPHMSVSHCIAVYICIILFSCAWLFRHAGLLKGAICLVMLLVFASNYMNLVTGYKDRLAIFYLRDGFALTFYQYGKGQVFTTGGEEASARIRSALNLWHATADVPWTEIFDHTNLTIRFKDKRIAVCSDRRAAIEPGKLDWLVIRNNGIEFLESLAENTEIGQIILDTSNSTEMIIQYKECGTRLGIPVHVLKENFAYVWEG